MPPIRRKNNKIDNTTRERIIELVTDQGRTMASVAHNFNIPASTVRSIVSTFLHTSRVNKLPRGGNRKSKIEQAYLDWLTENLDEFAGHPIQWLTVKLNEHFQIHPPLTQHSVDRAINKLTAYTLKLMRVEPERYNDPERIEGRRQWAENVLHGPGNMNNFVYIDEAGFNLHITRKYGRAPRGRCAFQRVPYNRGPNMSLVVAVDKTGILAHIFKRGAYNQESFAEFLEDQLFPRLDGRRRILLMDNAKFHKTQRVKDAITAGGHTLLLLPPYSPHLNAAESVFSSVKTHVRQETVVADTLPGHVTSGLARITATMARGWIREVGRNFQLSLAGTPLGRLYDVRQALPEGYHDPYVEGWDGESEHEEEEEEEEEEDVDEDEEEDNNDDEGEEVEEDDEEEEDGNDDNDEEDEVQLLARSKYSPLRTRSGKARN